MAEKTVSWSRQCRGVSRKLEEKAARHEDILEAFWATVRVIQARRQFGTEGLEAIDALKERSSEIDFGGGEERWWCVDDPSGNHHDQL